MTDEEWEIDWVRVLGMRLGGGALAEVDASGEHVVDDAFLLLLNGFHEAIAFTIPRQSRGRRAAWQVEVDTAVPESVGRVVAAGQTIDLLPRSLLLLRLPER